MIAALKFVHLGALACWCAALIALPLLLRAYGSAQGQSPYARFRLITHFGYIAFATPAAVLTVIAGTALIFAAQVFEPWLLAKLVFVAAMVMMHVWIGHQIQAAADAPHRPNRSAALVALFLVLPLMALVLALVLAKPDLQPLRDLIPPQLLSPREVSL